MIWILMASPSYTGNPLSPPPPPENSNSVNSVASNCFPVFFGVKGRLLHHQIFHIYL
jgi:hypothetical protein